MFRERRRFPIRSRCPIFDRRRLLMLCVQARNAYLVRSAGFAEMLDRHTIEERVVYDKVTVEDGRNESTNDYFQIESVISSSAHARAAKRFVKQVR